MSAAPIAISYRFLLGVYLAVPLCILLQAVDALGGTQALRIEPLSEGDPSLWALVGMGLPHILASSVLLGTNGEYLRAFRGRVVLTVVAIGAFFLVASRLPYEVGFAVLGVLTVAHVFHQQMGIGKALCRCPPRRYAAWTTTSVGVGALLYERVYLGASLPSGGRTALEALLVAASLLFLGLSVTCHRGIPTRRGRWYLWANVSMVLAGVHLFFTGWWFLALLGPRIVHDLTAFGFYVVHDHNRHAEAPRNLLYRATQRLRLGTLWVPPAVGLLLTFALHRFGEPALRGLSLLVSGTTPSQPLSLYAVVSLMLMHYSTEAVTWKKTSPYRTFVRVAP